MSYHVYHNPRNVTLTDRAIPGVLSISWTIESGEMLRAGDDDYCFSVARHLRCTLRGQIDLLDIVTAQDLAGARGTLTFDLDSDAGPKRIVLTDCSLGSIESQAAFDKSPSCRIQLLAEALPLCQDIT
jgi:hypothetical protein